ncbi:MAG: phosphoribosylformylglycinamidine synthase I [Bdellovibrionales bacterium]|nr:phosphoribosylformylglycinamidine synthase I [Bdellovibrionales bacterium]
MSDIAIVVFPGSNCDRDAMYAFSHLLQRKTVFHWYDEPLKKETKLVVLPGGFSYGDYLRAGAIARFSSAIGSLPEYLDGGGKVLGICNGFQILVEANLLPGLLLKNASLKFQCQSVFVRLETTDTPFLQGGQIGDIYQMPIAHSEGRYVVSENNKTEFINSHQIVLKYCDAEGVVSDDTNANGSELSIAGVVNKQGNVFGLMPHPERACEKLVGSDDGLRFLKMIHRAL